MITEIRETIHGTSGKKDRAFPASKYPGRDAKSAINIPVGVQNIVPNSAEQVVNEGTKAYTKVKNTLKISKRI